MRSRCKSSWRDHFSSRGEITIMQRFERCVVGGSPAARSIFSAWPRRLRPPPSKRIDAGANPAAGTFGGETGQGAGTRLKRLGRPRAAGEHDLSPPPIFRRVEPRSAVIGWKPIRAARLVGQDHCSPPLWRVNPPRCGHCFESRWIGSAGWGASPPLSANFSSCSSKAEQSADNRSNTERYRARGPFSRRVNSGSREPRC